MKFKDFLLIEDVTPSIDDNDVINTLDNYGITYTRTKDDTDLMYAFDNRFSLKYDGSTFTLYRSENKIHMMNARNKNEIDKAISSWTDSYELASAENNSDEDDTVDNEYDVDTDTEGRTDVTDDNVEDVVQKMKDDANNKKDNKEDDFYSKLNKGK